MYVVVAEGVTAWVPPVDANVYALPSDPLIATEVAFVAVTVSVDELPVTTVAGFAEIVTVGPGFAETVTVTVAVAVPPGPLALAVYVVVAEGLTACVPPLDTSV